MARELDVRILPGLEAVAAEAEAAVIATPTSSHAEVAERLIEAGCDVLIEKPIAATLPEAERILSLARARRKVVQVGHVERYNPAVTAALTMIRDPLFVEVHRLGVFTRRSLDVDVVLDLMIHDLQIVRALVGRPPVEIRAAGVAVLTPKIDIANARICFAGGCVANLTASRVSDKKVRKLRVFASSGYVSIDMLAQTVWAARISRESAEPEIAPVEVVVERGEPLALELMDFVRAVRARGPARFRRGGTGMRWLWPPTSFSRSKSIPARGPRPGDDGTRGPIGVVGGSGVYDLSGIEGLAEERIETPSVALRPLLHRLARRQTRRLSPGTVAVTATRPLGDQLPRQHLRLQDARV